MKILYPQVSKGQIQADPTCCKTLPKVVGLWVYQIYVLWWDQEIGGFPNNDVNFPLIRQLVKHVTQVYNLMMPGTQIQKAQCFTDTYCCQVNRNSTLLMCFLTLAHRYAIFLCSWDVEIYIYDSIVSWATNYSYLLFLANPSFCLSDLLFFTREWTPLPTFWPISCQPLTQPSILTCYQKKPKREGFTDTYCCHVNLNSTPLALLMCFLTSSFLYTPLPRFLTPNPYFSLSDPIFLA